MTGGTGQDEGDAQRSGAGPVDEDRAARERLAREARQTVTTLLDWVGTRVEASREPGGPERPPQSAGPCGWCPVCALAAALRGEQPQLTASLAEQASGLLVLLRLLVQSHAGAEHGHHAPPAPGVTPTTPPGWPAEWGAPSWAPSGPATEEPAVPWEAPHAMFDPTPAAGIPVAAGEEPRTERPTGRRGPRPSPRHPLGGLPDEAPPAPPAAPAPAAPAPAATRTPGPVTRSRSGVQRIPVRRRPRPC